MRSMFAVCLLAAGMAVAAIPAHADQDAVQFGKDIHVTADSTVHDAVCFFCSVRVEGKVTGDIVVFFGNVHLAGDAQHDVVDFFGSVAAEDNSSIDDDLVSFFGAVRLGENVNVGKDLVSVLGSLHTADSVSVGQDRTVVPGWVFWGPLFILVLIIVLIVREVRAYHRRLILRGYQFPPKQP